MPDEYQDPTPAAERLDIREYLRPIREHWLIVLEIVLVITVASYLYSSSKEPYYLASTKVLNETSSPLGTDLAGAGSTEDRNRTAQTQTALLQTRSAAKDVARELGFKGDPGVLRAMVTVGPVQNSDFILISAKASQPVPAAQVANAYARKFVELRDSSLKKQARDLREKAEQELARTPDDELNSVKRDELTNRIKKLSVAEAVPGGYARQLDPATPPYGQGVKPSPTRNAIFAFLVGLILAAGVAYGLALLDRRLKRPEDIEGLYKSRVLSHVPSGKHLKPAINGRATLPPELSEAFRTLRTNLEIASTLRAEDGDRLKTILVTSAMAAEGKSVTVRNLALAYAEAGQSVAVIDADLRNPRVSQLFGASREPGLLNVLIGDIELDEGIQHIETHAEGLDTLVRMLRAQGEGPEESPVGVALERRQSGPSVTSPHSENGSNGAPTNGHGGARSPGSLSFLSAGPPCANPASLLGSDRFRAVLDILTARHDKVLVDTAPLLPVSDTVPLLNGLDGVLVVARVGHTTRGAARQAGEVIQRVPNARLLGVVANDVRRHEDLGGYSYYGGHYGSPQSGKQATTA